MGKLGAQVPVITGCSTGIGLATARRFVAKGAYVFITGRRPAESDQAVERIGTAVIALQGDMSNRSLGGGIHDDHFRTFAAIRQNAQ